LKGHLHHKNPNKNDTFPGKCIANASKTASLQNAIFEILRTFEEDQQALGVPGSIVKIADYKTRQKDRLIARPAKEQRCASTIVGAPPLSISWQRRSARDFFFWEEGRRQLVKQKSVPLPSPSAQHPQDDVRESLVNVAHYVKIKDSDVSESLNSGPVVQWLAQWPFKPQTRVQFPSGLPLKAPYFAIEPSNFCANQCLVLPFEVMTSFLGL
jgi:hypothetical protein